MKAKEALVFLIILTPYANGHHLFRCTDLTVCYVKTEVCLRGKCVPKCGNDSDCEPGNICHQKYKVKICNFNPCITLVNFMFYPVL